MKTLKIILAAIGAIACSFFLWITGTTNDEIEEDES